MEVFSPEGPPKVWLHYHAVTVLVLFSPVVDLPQRWRYQCGPRPLGMTRRSSPRCRGTDPTWPDKRAAIQAQDRDRPAENLLVLDPFARPHGGRVEHQQQHQ